MTQKLQPRREHAEPVPTNGGPNADSVGHTETNSDRVGPGGNHHVPQEGPNTHVEEREYQVG